MRAAPPAELLYFVRLLFAPFWSSACHLGLRRVQVDQALWLLIEADPLRGLFPCPLVSGHHGGRKPRLRIDSPRILHLRIFRDQAWFCYAGCFFFAECFVKLGRCLEEGVLEPRLSPVYLVKALGDIFV